jgi:hypothetical protein
VSAAATWSSSRQFDHRCRSVWVRLGVLSAVAALACGQARGAERQSVTLTCASCVERQVSPGELRRALEVEGWSVRGPGQNTATRRGEADAPRLQVDCDGPARLVVAIVSPAAPQPRRIELADVPRRQRARTLAIIAAEALRALAAAPPRPSSPSTAPPHRRDSDDRSAQAAAPAQPAPPSAAQATAPAALSAPLTRDPPPASLESMAPADSHPPLDGRPPTRPEDASRRAPRDAAARPGAATPRQEEPDAALSPSQGSTALREGAPSPRAAPAEASRLARNLALGLGVSALAPLIIGAPLVALGERLPMAPIEGLIVPGALLLGLSGTMLVGSAVSLGVWLRSRPTTAPAGRQR